MKKTILSAIALLFAVGANAQNMDASKERIAKLEKLTPEKVSMSNIDALANKAIEAKKATLEIDPILVSYYNAANGIGESVAITDEDCKKLYDRITSQKKLVEDAAGLITKAGEDIKNAKATAKVKCTKSVNTSKDIFKLVSEETVHQLEVIANVIPKIQVSVE